MQNSSYAPGRAMVTDRNPPVRFSYVVDPSPRPVKLFTFDSGDDPYIKSGSKPFLITCSRENYPELRARFAQVLGAFVVRINHGLGNSPGFAWNDCRMNPYNQKFREILSGSFGRDAELFVIPLRPYCGGEWLPEGGVKFVTEQYHNFSDMKQGTLNLVMGEHRVRHDAMHLDFYVSTGPVDDLVLGVESA